MADEQFRLASHALASMDLMGYLIYRRYVSRKDAIALWGVAIVRVHHAASESGYLAYRDEHIGTPDMALYAPYRRLDRERRTRQRQGACSAEAISCVSAYSVSSRTRPSTRRNTQQYSLWYLTPSTVEFLPRPSTTTRSSSAMYRCAEMMVRPRSCSDIGRRRSSSTDCLPS